MNLAVVSDPITQGAVEVIRQRARVLLLLEASERVGIAPIRTSRLHAFAYLADVLSPVWKLVPFDGTVLKIEGGPHYPDLQRELDRLVILGLVEISELSYLDRPHNGARIDASYALNLQSPALQNLLRALGAGDPSLAIDSQDVQLHAFLVDLAGALSTIPGDQIDAAASIDATYADQRIGVSNVIDFGDWAQDSVAANLSFRAVQRFDSFLPQGVSIGAGEKLYLYASYLGRRIHA